MTCTLCELVRMSEQVGRRMPLAVAIVKGCAVGKTGADAWEGFELCPECLALMHKVVEGHNQQVSPS